MILNLSCSSGGDLVHREFKGSRSALAGKGMWKLILSEKERRENPEGHMLSVTCAHNNTYSTYTHKTLHLCSPKYTLYTLMNLYPIMQTHLELPCRPSLYEWDVTVHVATSSITSNPLAIVRIHPDQFESVQQ